MSKRLHSNLACNLTNGESYFIIQIDIIIVYELKKIYFYEAL